MLVFALRATAPAFVRAHARVHLLHALLHFRAARRAGAVMAAAKPAGPAPAIRMTPSSVTTLIVVLRSHPFARGRYLNFVS